MAWVFKYWRFMMAASDYRSCDICGCKTFYDAELQYDFKKYPETGLYNLGDWVCLCNECSKTYEVTIQRKETKNGN